MNSYYSYVRPEIVERVPVTAARVLDIGCGAGALGAALKQRQECEVWGIESDPGAAEAAQAHLDRVLPFDVERMVERIGVLPTDDGARADFDCIIMGDVLEHLREPAQVLAWARMLLAEDGVLLVSIPNARHWTVVAGLIEGGWTYEAAGLLDRTHLRFFTRREARCLLDAQGFAVSEETAVRGEGFAEWEDAGKPGEVRGGRWQVNNLSEEDALEFYAYQWLFTCHRRPVPECGLTSIVIPVYNGRADTYACLASIGKHTPEEHEVIVVDNGSTDGTAAWLATQDVTVIRNEENRGFPAACNQGIAAARGQQVVVLNNDTVVTPGWLRRMLECLYHDPQVGAVGPRSNFVSGAQRLAQHYSSIQQLDGWAWGWSERHRGEYLPTARLVGFCLLLRGEMLKQIGGFDEQFGIGNCEDDDLCRRAEAAGWKLLVANDSFVHHAGHKTFEREGIALGPLLQENAQKLAVKWAG